MMRPLALTALFSVALFGAATLPSLAHAADGWKVDPAQSSLTFEATQMGEAVKGSFKRWTAEIAFSPDDLAGSSVTVTIDVTSADTQSEERDGQLGDPDFFDTKQHPQAVFASQRIVKGEGAAYRAEGTLTLKGKAVPLVLTFTPVITGNAAKAEGEAALDRTQWEIGWPSGEEIGTAVKVRFTVNATKATP